MGAGGVEKRRMPINGAKVVAATNIPDATAAIAANAIRLRWKRGESEVMLSDKARLN